MSVQVIVQYQVIVSQAYDAYYKLTDPHLQIRSYVFSLLCEPASSFLLSVCLVIPHALLSSSTPRLLSSFRSADRSLLPSFLSSFLISLLRTTYTLQVCGGHCAQHRAQDGAGLGL